MKEGEVVPATKSLPAASATTRWPGKMAQSQTWSGRHATHQWAAGMLAHALRVHAGRTDHWTDARRRPRMLAADPLVLAVQRAIRMLMRANTKHLQRPFTYLSCFGRPGTHLSTAWRYVGDVLARSC